MAEVYGRLAHRPVVLLSVVVMVASLPSCSDQSAPPGADSGAAGSEGGAAIPENPVFTRDIAPIVFDNCSLCHRPGEAAPFSLLTYRDVAKRGRQISEVTASRYMPPWLPDPAANHFEGERTLTEVEIGTIARWVEQGAPEGDPAALPELPQFVDGWQLGDPDLVVTMGEPFRLPADGEDIYRNFVIPIPLDRARYVRAMELRPGNPRVVHHAFMLIDTSRESRRLDALDEPPGYPGMDTGTGAASPSGHFISWQPGKQASFSPPGMSWRLAPQTDLVLQLHMQTTGKEESVQSSVGFYFTDEPPQRVPYKIVLRSTEIDIPPGTSDYTIGASYRLPVDVYALGVIPHAHYLGKQLQGYATLPDGKRQWLMKIDDWDFNWQGDYRYETPIFLPKGSLISQHFTYDNSAENPRNPHSPPQRVTYGLQTTDEMGELWLQLLPSSQKDYAILNRDYGRFSLEESIKFYQARLASDPQSASDYTKLGKAQYALGRQEEALASITRSIEIDPGQGEPFYLLGMISVQRKQMEAAREQFERCVKNQPTHTAALNGLGMIALRTKDLPVALKYFSLAERSDTENDAVLYNLGLVLVRLGRSEEGVAFLERALAINPQKKSAAELLQRVRDAR
ncbi:MAG: tetratricopeptide repeat protein [Verrucomicrobiales bacterium]